MRILGHRLHGKAADALQRAAPQNRAGAAEERRVPEIVSRLHQPVEHIALVRHGFAGREVLLERIERVEMMRCLYHRHFAVAPQPAQRHLQKGARWNMVAIENRDELAVRELKGMVQIAGLGMRVVGARDIAAPGQIREFPEARPFAVVQNINIQLGAGIIHRHRGQHGLPHDIEILVVGRHINIYCRPVRRRAAQGHRLAVERPGGLEIAECQHQHRISFRQHQPGAKQRFGQRVVVQRVGGPPDDIAERHGDRERDQEKRDGAALEAIRNHEDRKTQNCEDHLLKLCELRQRHRPQGQQS